MKKSAAKLRAKYTPPKSKLPPHDEDFEVKEPPFVPPHPLTLNPNEGRWLEHAKGPYDGWFSFGEHGNPPSASRFRSWCWSLARGHSSLSEQPFAQATSIVII